MIDLTVLIIDLMKPIAVMVEKAGVSHLKTTIFLSEHHIFGLFYQLTLCKSTHCITESVLVDSTKEVGRLSHNIHKNQVSLRNNGFIRE